MSKYLSILEIHSGGWLLLSILYFFANLDEFLIVIACVMIHEAGHLLILEWFGVRVRRIVFDFTGLTIWYNESMLCGFRECVAALSGPALGLLAAAVCSCLGNALESERLLLLAGGNAVLSAFNLLPAKPLDGWRCLHALFPTMAQIVSVCTALIILIVGLWVMYAGYGTALAIMGIMLLLQEAPEKRRRQLGMGTC